MQSTKKAYKRASSSTSSAAPKAAKKTSKAQKPSVISHLSSTITPNQQHRSSSHVEPVRVRSIRDLNYSTIKKTLRQATVLRHKVHPLRSIGATSIASPPGGWLKPLDGMHIGLTHTLAGPKDMSHLVAESNLPHALSIVGADVDIVNLNWVTSQAIPSSMKSLQKDAEKQREQVNAIMDEKQPQQDLLDDLVTQKIRKKYPSLGEKPPLDVILHYSNAGSRRSPAVIANTETSAMEYVYKATLPTKSMETSSPATFRGFESIPSIVLTSPTSSIIPLLTIFSLLPQHDLFVTPNKLKIAFIGYDYSNRGFVQDLVYICQNMGINLSISTPNPPPLDLTGGSDDSFADEEVKRLKDLEKRQIDNTITPQEQEELKQAKNINHFNYSYVYAAIKKAEKGDEEQQQLQKKRKQSNTKNESSNTGKESISSSILQYHSPPTIEYVKHPFLAISMADAVITNSIIPAATKFTESRGYEVDKEMLTFAKDHVKMFHVTEGMHKWTEPPLGVHDPRCMLEQQAIAENYTLASLVMTVLDKNIM